MFGGACAARIDRVEIHFEVVSNIARNHGALQEVNVIQCVSDPRRIVQVLQRAFTEIVARHINHIYRRTCCAVMHALPAQIEVMDRTATTERQVFAREGKHVFDQGTRKTDAPVAALNGACAS